MYEQGIDRNFEGTPLAGGTSAGVHESQSRTWENIVGRSRSFCAWLHPRLAEWLPGTVEGLDAAGLYRAVNTVQPSLIRTEADETTYNLHIVLRFELERALIQDTLAVADLPAAWSNAMRRYLGIAPPSDRDGVLQDVHWASGAIGYFPTYTLGNIYAAELAAAAEGTVGPLHDLGGQRSVAVAVRLAYVDGEP